MVTKRTTSKPKPAIYARVARASDVAIERQVEACRKLLTASGYSGGTALVFADNGVSASAQRQPGKDQLLEAIKAGEISVLAAFHVDRFPTEPARMRTLLDAIDEAGVHVMFRVGGELGLTILRILCGILDEQRQDHSDRTKRGIARRREQQPPH